MPGGWVCFYQITKSHSGMTRIFQIKNYDGKLPFFWKKKPTVQQKRNFRVNMYLSFEYKNTLCRIVMFWIEFNLWQTHFRGDCSLHQLYQNCSLFMQIKNPQRIDPGIGQDSSNKRGSHNKRPHHNISPYGTNTKMFVSKWNICSLSGTRRRQSLHCKVIRVDTRTISYK